jgi:molybdopterin synthase sulfur carrier subunit
MIRIVLPHHLRTLARVGEEVELQVEGRATQRSVLDALETRYPILRGTIRDHVTQERRAFLRFFACEEDLSHEPPDAPLPEAVAQGAEERQRATGTDSFTRPPGNRVGSALPPRRRRLREIDTSCESLKCLL